MKIVLGFVATAALALAIGGCGSSSGGGDGLGGGPDFAAVQARFDKPDGTFSSGNAAQVLQHGTDGSSSTADLNLAGGSTSSTGSSTTTKSMGLQLLDAASVRPSSSPFGACSALASGQRSGSCACPAGGSIDYDITGSGQAGAGTNGVMSFRMNACASGDTTIDGTEYIDIHSDTSDQQHPLYSMLLAIDATVTNAGVSKHIDLQWRYSNGVTEIAVKVDDGWVVVGISSSANGQSGTWSVRDKNGSWTCTLANGHGTCSGSNGETRTF